MSSAAIEAQLSGAPELLIHIGAGEGELAGLASRARRAVLIEPDPARFAELKQRLFGLPGVELKQAALADDARSLTFRQSSLGRFGSSRQVTGAQTLFPGLRSAGESEVRGAQLKDLVGGELNGVTTVVVVDAVSEGMVALQQIEALGLLYRAKTFIKVAEIALHKGGATRSDVEAWVDARGFKLERLEEIGDPEIWMGWLKPQPDMAAPAGDESAEAGEFIESEGCKLARLEARCSLLEERHEAQQKLVQKHRGKAYRSSKQLEKAQKSLEEARRERDADREALVKSDAALAAAAKRLSEEQAARSEATQSLADVEQTIAPVRAELNHARKAEKNYKDQLDALTEQSRGDRSRLVEESRARRKAEVDAQELEQMLAAKSEELDNLHEKLVDLHSNAGELDAAREASKRAESHVKELESELRSLRDQTAGAERSSEGLKVLLDKEREVRADLEASLDARIKEATAASNDLETVRGDLALALRTQNMVQADLQDLQARHEALQTEKGLLEELLGKLMDRLYEASDRVKALSWAASSEDDACDRPSAER